MKVSRISVVLAATTLLLSMTVVLAAQAGQAGQAPGGAGAGQGGGAGRGAGGAAPAAGAPAGGGGGQGRGGGGGGGGRGAGGGGAAAAPAPPAPRWPDGKIRLGNAPGEKGLWFGAFTATGTDIPYQEWARGVAQVRRDEKLEPHARCKPSGALRQFQTPYGVDIVEVPEIGRVYIMDVGGPHTFRTIYTDGTQHPTGKDLDAIRSYYGHSIGSWDGDTFVIDTVGYNEKFWIDRGDQANTAFVHTPQARTIERLTRINANTIQYQLTIDDPHTYTKPWTANNYTISKRADTELFEYICQDNNQGDTLMVGSSDSVDRTSPIVP
jgi:hypothetical protein